MPESREQARKRVKGRYYRRQAEGLCGLCGLKRDSTRYKTCSKCRAKAKIKSRERYNRLKEEGLCQVCLQPAGDGRVYCEDCSMDKSNYDAAYYRDVRKPRNHDELY